tara:strand:- start:2697 stop:2831 length:135 start_codon:yes stop_codon:yes gene_type:complete
MSIELSAYGNRIRQAYSHLRLRRFKAHSGWAFEDDVGHIAAAPI